LYGIAGAAVVTGAAAIIGSYSFGFEAAASVMAGKLAETVMSGVHSMVSSPGASVKSAATAVHCLYGMAGAAVVTGAAAIIGSYSFGFEAAASVVMAGQLAVNVLSCS
jgi:hypothetical protein